MSIDAILLAACINDGKTILDVGSGVGASSLCLMKRDLQLKITGIDLQEINIKLAIQNALKNNLPIQFKQFDISKEHLDENFDHVMSNPPFYEKNKINLPQNEHKLLSNVLMNITLQKWLEFCIQHSSDYVTIIHLPEYRKIILKIFAEHFQSIKIFPIYVKGKEKRIIVQGSKKQSSDFILHEGLILQDEFAYTKAAKDILEQPKGIIL